MIKKFQQILGKRSNQSWIHEPLDGSLCHNIFLLDTVNDYHKEGRKVPRRIIGLKKLLSNFKSLVKIYYINFWQNPWKIFVGLTFKKVSVL